MQAAEQAEEQVQAQVQDQAQVEEPGSSTSHCWGAGEREGGGKEVGGNGKVTQVIPYLAASADCGRGWTINTSQGGKRFSLQLGERPLEIIPEGGPIKEALAGDSSSL